MTVNVDPPTCREVDAAELVLAEAHGMRVDGYFRELGRSVLEAANDAGLQECIEDLDREIATYQRSDRELAQR